MQFICKRREDLVLVFYYLMILFIQEFNSILEWLKCRCIVLYNQLQKQRMDHNPPDNASEQTLPS